MKYVIVDEIEKTKTAKTKDSLMFESCAQVEYVISNHDIRLYIDNYFFSVDDITEFIAFLTATREYLIKQPHHTEQS